MAGYETPREIAAAFIDGLKPTARLATMTAHGNYSLTSYRLPIAVRDHGAPRDECWLIDDGYDGATTARHIRATALELNDHGYGPTLTTRTENCHLYRRWMRGVRVAWRFGRNGSVILIDHETP